MLQAAGGGVAFALTRAIARDIGGKDEAAATIGYVTMVMVVVPMLAPLIGGTVEKAFGWRTIFAVMSVVGLVACLGAVLKLPETRPPAAVPPPGSTRFAPCPRSRGSAPSSRTRSGSR